MCSVRGFDVRPCQTPTCMVSESQRVVHKQTGLRLRLSGYRIPSGMLYPGKRQRNCEQGPWHYLDSATSSTLLVFQFPTIRQFETPSCAKTRSGHVLARGLAHTLFPLSSSHPCPVSHLMQPILRRGSAHLLLDHLGADGILGQVHAAMYTLDIVQRGLHHDDLAVGQRVGFRTESDGQEHQLEPDYTIRQKPELLGASTSRQCAPLSLHAVGSPTAHYATTYSQAPRQGHPR